MKKLIMTIMMLVIPSVVLAQANDGLYVAAYKMASEHCECIENLLPYGYVPYPPFFPDFQRFRAKCIKDQTPRMVKVLRK